MRKTALAAGHGVKWNGILGFLTATSIAILVLHYSYTPSQLIGTWVGHAVVGLLIYWVFTKPELRKARQVLYALIPLIAINLLEDVVKIMDRQLRKDWDSYFDVAELFALFWMVAMLIINNRQQKALEKERLRSEEKEKEYKITEKIKAELEIQVRERTAELTRQKEELQQALHELKSTQTQLVHAEKMASLGELTAGIAHEIQNPLNFVNNFAEINTELIAEMKSAISKGDLEEATLLANDIADNEQKINHHGKRADAIVKGMLQHSRNSSGQKEPTLINALADEYLRLAYHGLRAKDKPMSGGQPGFNATLKTDFDDSIGTISVIPQDIGRVILNLFTNAFYAVTEKKKDGKPGYEPTVSVHTKKIGNRVQIDVSDNGNGIPQKLLDKIFQPFFTTKPTGQGTGLGLSLAYDIVKAHGGELKVHTKEGEGSTFTILLPI